MIAFELPVQFHLLYSFFTTRWELGLRLRAVESLGHAELTRGQLTLGDRQGRKPIGYGHRPVVDVLDYRESLLFFSDTDTGSPYNCLGLNSSCSSRKHFVAALIKMNKKMRLTLTT